MMIRITLLRRRSHWATGCRCYLLLTIGRRRIAASPNPPNLRTLTFRRAVVSAKAPFSNARTASATVRGERRGPQTRVAVLRISRPDRSKSSIRQSSSVIKSAVGTPGLGARTSTNVAAQATVALQGQKIGFKSLNIVVPDLRSPLEPAFKIAAPDHLSDECLGGFWPVRG